MDDIAARYTALVAKRPELAVTDACSPLWRLQWCPLLKEWNYTNGALVTNGFTNQEAHALITVKLLEALPHDHWLFMLNGGWCVCWNGPDKEIETSDDASSPVLALLAFHEQEPTDAKP